MHVICCIKNTMPIKRAAMHTHPDLEIIVHLDGAAVSLVDNQAHEIGPKNIVVIPPNVPHGGYAVSDGFTDMYLQIKNVGIKQPDVLLDADGSIEALMNIVNKVLTEKEENYQEIADSLGEAICQYVKRLSKKGSDFPFVHELKNTIYDNLSNPDFNITAEMQSYGFNIDYFRRCFKKEIGVSPLQYMTDLRLNRAKTMLVQETFTSIEDIAYSCGFNDSFYFSTCFRKHIHMSPLQYRKNQYNKE